jgi:hypothetical protein
MSFIAALPQRVWEVVTLVFGAYLVRFGLLDMFDQTRRGVVPGVSQIVLGIGLGVAGFLVNSEPSCGRCGHGPWGSRTMITAMVIWLILFVGTSVARLRRRKQRRAAFNPK